jgi:MFS family permease
VLWYVGSIFAAWITFGTSHMETSSWCWRIPSIVQAVPALFVACVVFLMPESPRYLYSRGLISEAEDVLTIYHANSDPTSPLVALELQEISAALSSESEFSKASFLSTLRSRENRRRYGICVAVALLTLWCGQGVISYYFSPILTSVGITSPTQQTGINGGMQIWNLLCSITGALLADRIGRRALWLSSFSGMILFNVPLTITSAIYARRGTKSAASATVALLFLYNAAFNLACNPLLYTYTTEILPYSIRARGLGVQIAVSEAALTVNQYVNPIALDRIGYYYYIFYLGVLFVGLVMIYFFFPETKGKTLEELSGLFVETEIGIEGDVVEMKQDDSLSLVKDHVEAQVGTVAVIR